MRRNKKMRKISLLCIVFILFLSVNLIGQSVEENPITSFMGVKWGVTATEFENTCWYKDQLKKRDYDFYLSNFKLGDLTIGEIKFIFEGKENDRVRLLKRNYDRTFFTEAYIFIKPEQFEGMLDIFKIKYGDPHKFVEHPVRNRSGEAFMQKIAEWVDKENKRMIIMERQASKLVDGVVMLIPYETKVIKEKKDSKKEAASRI